MWGAYEGNGIRMCQPMSSSQVLHTRARSLRTQEDGVSWGIVVNEDVKFFGAASFSSHSKPNVVRKP